MEARPVVIGEGCHYLFLFAKPNEVDNGDKEELGHTGKGETGDDSASKSLPDRIRERNRYETHDGGESGG